MSHDLALDYAIDEFLSNYGVTFNYSVDLGSGSGSLGYLIRKYSNWLVGVDLDCSKLEEAYDLGFYGEVINADVRDFKFDSRTDSVFALELLEHLPKEDGLRLLIKTQPYFTMISTPTNFYTDAETNHESLWTVEDFENFGFTIYIVKPISWMTQQKFSEYILAVRSK